MDKKIYYVSFENYLKNEDGTYDYSFVTMSDVEKKFEEFKKAYEYLEEVKICLSEGEGYCLHTMLLNPDGFIVSEDVEINYTYSNLFAS